MNVSEKVFASTSYRSLMCRLKSPNVMMLFLDWSSDIRSVNSSRNQKLVPWFLSEYGGW